MLETPHVVVGAAIATKITNPIISIPLVVVSHFVLDMVPHWNPHLNTEKAKLGKVTAKSQTIVMMDVLAALVLGSLIALRAWPDIYQVMHILAACLVSVLPDVVEGPYFFWDVKNKFMNSWIDFQKSIQADALFWPGVATQVVTIIASLGWILS